MSNRFDVEAKEEELNKAKGNLMLVSRAVKTAKEFQESPLYFVAKLDWRGRVYYSSGSLNPQSTDSVKGMLRLAEGKPLGERGFLWLCWSVATNYGFDKAGFEERVGFTLRHLRSVYEVACNANSRHAKKIMSTADAPSLFIQGCRELVRAFDSGDKFSYVSNILVGIDASASGIQFLSAVAGDVEGSSKVNVINTEGQTQKADMYSLARDTAMERVRIEMQGTALLAWLEKNPITRKVAKRPVMTLPYAGTEQSATDNIIEELQAAGYPLPTGDEREAIRKDLCRYLRTSDDKFNTDGGLLFALAKFMAREIRGACAQHLPAAMQILDVLKKKLPKLKQAHIEWVTPDGLYVKNEYNQLKNEKLHYRQHEERGADVTFSIETDKADFAKAGLGIVPNWIHSLDASLVRAVARRVEFQMVAVHDQFLAHPSDMDMLFQVAKEEFVNIIKSDPLRLLLDMNNASELYYELYVGGLDLEAVKESKFMFC